MGGFYAIAGSGRKLEGMNGEDGHSLKSSTGQGEQKVGDRLKRTGRQNRSPQTNQ
nr:hypothetical protein [Odoribacter splanchnicus]